MWDGTMPKFILECLQLLHSFVEGEYSVFLAGSGIAVYLLFEIIAIFVFCSGLLKATLRSSRRSCGSGRCRLLVLFLLLVAFRHGGDRFLGFGCAPLSRTVRFDDLAAR